MIAPLPSRPVRRESTTGTNYHDTLHHRSFSKKADATALTRFGVREMCQINRLRMVDDKNGTLD